MDDEKILMEKQQEPDQKNSNNLLKDLKKLSERTKDIFKNIEAQKELRINGHNA